MKVNFFATLRQIVAARSRPSLRRMMEGGAAASWLWRSKRKLTGTGDEGHVIESFGEFVVGGDYAVGAVVFVILTIIISYPFLDIVSQ